MGFWENLLNAGKTALKVEMAAGTAVIGKLAANSGVDIGDVDVLSVASYSVGALTVLANDGAAWTEIAPGAVREMIVRPQDPAHTLKVGSSAAPGTAYELVPAGDFFQHPCTASVWVQLSASGNVSVRKYS